MRISCTHFVVRVCALHPFYRQNSANTTLRLSREEQQSHTVGAKDEN
ncbi:MAG: hypothetical protein II986_08750 [Alistipes sp.]|nr:hypothetical protein [Alistipes sp.]